MERAEKAMKAALPSAGYLFKKIPTWKMSVRDWDPEEFKTQTAALFEQLNDHYGWLQEKIEYHQEEAFHAYKSDKKEKMRERMAEVMAYETKIAIVEFVGPLVENVQANAKTLRKEKKCPEELVKDVSTVVYLADYFSIPAFQRFKHQLHFRFGEKFVDKISEKGQNVDPKVLELVKTVPESKAVKERCKEYTEKCKQRIKDEAAVKAAKEAAKVDKPKKSKKRGDSDSEASDSDSEEEKPKKKDKKKPVKESESESEEEKPKKKDKKKKPVKASESESEEEKPKKKEKEKEKKKVEKVSSDSEDDPKKGEEKPKKEAAAASKPAKESGSESDSE